MSSISSGVFASPEFKTSLTDCKNNTDIHTIIIKISSNEKEFELVDKVSAKGLSSVEKRIGNLKNTVNDEQPCYAFVRATEVYMYIPMHMHIHTMYIYMYMYMCIYITA